jgi:predicted methyltransferase
MSGSNSIKFALLLSASVVLSACSQSGHVRPSGTDTGALQQAISSRSQEAQNRDAVRHPAATLTFFKVAPGMTVAEALPGGGWYSNVLARYLGTEGTLYGVNYVDHMWARFGFFDEAGIQQRIASTDKFSTVISDLTDNGIKAAGYTFATLPEAINGTVDRVLFIRALHNLNRFEEETGTLTESLNSAYRILKKDGLVGVVQHQLAEDSPDAGADGSRGYLKQSQVIAVFAKAGFELVASSGINANPLDMPGDADIVWRLPPNYVGTREDKVKKSAVDAIGESNRMTLLFKKVG